MASHSSTNTYLRASVFDAALDIGLVDPKLAMWLDDIPESPAALDDKGKASYARVGGPPSNSSSYQTFSSPGSDFSHSSHTTVVTSPSASSHDGNPFYTYSQRPANAGPQPRRRAPAAAYVEPRSHFSAWTDASPILPSNPEPLPPPPPPPSAFTTKASRKMTKLVKKQRPSETGSKKPSPSDNKGRSSQEKRSEDSSSTGPNANYAFLSEEPAAGVVEKESSRSFFGRLRDRSRSKSRARKAGGDDAKIRKSDDTAETAVDEAATPNRGRSAGRMAVTVTVKGGAPQLQLEPRNRQSADLLSSLNLTSASPPQTLLLSSAAAATPAYQWPTAVPLPVGTSVLDRPHPKTRNSGFWANKDRGMSPAATATRNGTVRVGPAGVARKGSRKVAAGSGRVGARRVPSTRRARNSRASKTLSSASTMTLQILAESEPIATPETKEEEQEIVEDDDAYVGQSFLSNPSTPGFLDEPPPNTASAAKPEGEENPVLSSIPVIVERQPSTKSTSTRRSSTRPVPPSLSLAPVAVPRLPPGVLGRPPNSPASARLSSRISRHLNLPSPLKPPTSPLPPTPTSTLAPSPGATPSTLATTPPPPGDSDWYDYDDDTSVLSETVGVSRAETPMMTEDYIVPTPNAVSTTFQATSAVVVPDASTSTPIPRPAGRAPLTPEGRARAGSLLGANRPSLYRPTPPPAPTPTPPPTSAVGPPLSKASLNAFRFPPQKPAPVVEAPRPERRSALQVPTPLNLGPKFPTPSTSPKPLLREPERASIIPSPALRPPSRPITPGTPQRGRASPFPTRPTVQIPQTSLSRAPSASGGNSERAAPSSFRPATAPEPEYRRQSGFSLEVSPISGTVKARPSMLEPPKVIQVPRYNDLPLRAFIPAQQPKAFETKEVQPQPLPLSRKNSTLTVATPTPRPRTPEELREMLQLPDPQPLRIPKSPMRASPEPPRATSRLGRQGTFPPSSEPRVGSMWTVKTRSVYSTGATGMDSDEEEDGFQWEDYEDERDSNGSGFDVIAAKLLGNDFAARTKPRTKQDALLNAIQDDDRKHLRALGQPQTLLAPPSPASPARFSPQPSPKRRAAGGSQWI